MYRLKREINSDEFTRQGRYAVWRGDSHTSGAIMGQGANGRYMELGIPCPSVPQGSGKHKLSRWCLGR